MKAQMTNGDIVTGLRQMARVLDATGQMVARVLDNVERLVADVARDSQEVARESERLYAAALEAAQAARGTVRAAPRFARVVGEVIRIAAAYRIHAARAPLLPAGEARARLEALHARSARRLYALCVEQRGGVLKIGQFAASRVDLLPRAYVEELSRLQDRVPPVPAAGIRARVEVELGRPVAEIFTRFDDEPIAAASLAQVHGAELGDGRRVVVKVQVPGIEDSIEIDRAALRVLGRTLAGLFPGIDLATIAAELSRALAEEVDYEREAENAATFGARFAATPGVVVPKIIREHSARRVLTMERIDGQRIVEWLDAAAPGDRDAVFHTLIECFCAQVLDHGFFHADPHPGNFLVTVGRELAILDFGCVQVYPAPVRRAYAALGSAILARDADRMAALFHAMGFRTRGGDPLALQRFGELFLELFSENEGDLSRIDPLAQAERALALARENPIVSIPQDFVLLARVFATLGGLLIRYAPRIGLLAILLPHLAGALLHGGPATGQGSPQDVSA